MEVDVQTKKINNSTGSMSYHITYKNVCVAYTTDYTFANELKTKAIKYLKNEKYNMFDDIFSNNKLKQMIQDIDSINIREKKQEIKKWNIKTYDSVENNKEIWLCMGEIKSLFVARISDQILYNEIVDVLNCIINCINDNSQYSLMVSSNGINDLKIFDRYTFETIFNWKYCSKSLYNLVKDVAYHIITHINGTEIMNKYT